MKKLTLKTLLCILASTSAWAQSGSVYTLDYTSGEVETPQKDISTLVQEALNEGFSYLKYNDLRDVVNHDKALPGTSNHILLDMAHDASKYAGADVSFYLDKGNQPSPIGPIGHVTTADNGKKVFKVTDPRSNRRRDTILSVTYERIWDVTGEDKIFDIDLLLFIHSSERGGYYFRKINVETNWHEKVNVPSADGMRSIAKTTVKKVYKEIPLSETDFELRVELASQKAILFDRAHGLTRVFPITAGALDIRSHLMGPQPVINSMSLLLPGRRGDFADFKLDSAVLVKRSHWSGSPNQEARIEPSYFKGRPFIGIIDTSRISKEGNYHQGYREVGFHYQIDDDALKRGFESHGCIRLQDHDLYVLDAILNAGPKDTIPVEAKMTLDVFKDIDSIYSRQKTYKKVIYSTRPNSPQTVKCENKAPYAVRFFENGYHTVADSDCLTRISADGEKLQDAVDYLLGVSSYSPTPLKQGDVNHVPIAAVLDQVKSAKYQDIMTYTFAETFPGSVKWVGDLNQDELNLLLENLKRNAEYGSRGYSQNQNGDYYGNNNGGGYNDGYGNSGGQTYNTNTNRGGGLFGSLFGGNSTPQPAYEQVWPEFFCARGSSHATRTNLQNYNGYCMGRVQNPKSSTPSNRRPRVNNCNAFYNALLNSGCGYR